MYASLAFNSKASLVAFDHAHMLQ